MCAKGTVLIVDDERAIRNVLEMALSARGYDVVTAASGHAAVSLGNECDAALIDVNMPGMDGFAVTRRLREKRPELPVWIMTGALTADSQAQAKDCGAVSLLRKPFTFVTLLNALERHMAFPAAGVNRVTPRL